MIFAACSGRSVGVDALELTLATQLTLRPERNAHATHAIDVTGGGRATSLASRFRFCAIAARVNSNAAPLGPRSRNRSRRKMRFKWANSIFYLFPITARLHVGFGFSACPGYIARPAETLHAD